MPVVFGMLAPVVQRLGTPLVARRLHALPHAPHRFAQARRRCSQIHAPGSATSPPARPRPHRRGEICQQTLRVHHLRRPDDPPSQHAANLPGRRGIEPWPVIALAVRLPPARRMSRPSPPHRAYPTGPGRVAHHAVLRLERLAFRLDQPQQAAQLLAAPAQPVDGLVEIAIRRHSSSAATIWSHGNAPHLPLHLRPRGETEAHPQNPNIIWPAGAPTATPSSASIRTLDAGAAGRRKAAGLAVARQHAMARYDQRDRIGTHRLPHRARQRHVAQRPRQFAIGRRSGPSHNPAAAHRRGDGTPAPPPGRAGPRGTPRHRRRHNPRSVDHRLDSRVGSPGAAPSRLIRRAFRPDQVPATADAPRHHRSSRCRTSPSAVSKTVVSMRRS